MEYLDGFSEFNPKNRLNAKEFVENNYYALKQLFSMDCDSYESDDAIKDVLVGYFTRFPEQISSISLKTFGVPKNYLLRLNNIGGVIKYR